MGSYDSLQSLIMNTYKEERLKKDLSPLPNPTYGIGIWGESVLLRNMIIMKSVNTAMQQSSTFIARNPIMDKDAEAKYHGYKSFTELSQKNVLFHEPAQYIYRPYIPMQISNPLVPDLDKEARYHGYSNYAEMKKIQGL